MHILVLEYIYIYIGHIYIYIYIIYMFSILICLFACLVNAEYKQISINECKCMLGCTSTVPHQSNYSKEQ